ncbi:DNA-binding IclR family transcriptional regulator [Spinactinospora alkalitolerans]|uniref:DNA-binding IclR family transcriptional regulator n=1 Tax=Spinactinospora alkalitolerans TaxID=687207 RepID=A0A852TYQ3_9ACTN|nr:IclR family transcriptional regulator [Spinactinospora alkalitolerans]NYE47923.1 DNA-binding IclR family transcriptional regulator [Spinactinospora alkalitolerans]
MSEQRDEAATGQHSNRSVDRALRLLRMVARTDGGASASELAAATSLARPTTFRLLATLEENGLLDRVGHRYVLGGELARLGALADQRTGFVMRVRSRVELAAQRLEETVTLSVRRPTDELDVVLQESAQRVGLTVADMVGQRWPMHASATGKVVLAELDESAVRRLLGEEPPPVASRTITGHARLQAELAEVRARGYATIDDELEDGIVSGAVPVRDDAGALVATLAVVGPKHRFGLAACRDAMPELLAAAHDIAKSLGASPTDTGPAADDGGRAHPRTAAAAQGRGPR